MIYPRDLIQEIQSYLPAESSRNDSFTPERALILTKNFWGLSKKGRAKILFAPIYYF